MPGLLGKVASCGPTVVRVGCLATACASDYCSYRSCWIYRAFHGSLFFYSECVVLVLMVIISLVGVVVGGI